MVRGARVSDPTPHLDRPPVSRVKASPKVLAVERGRCFERFLDTVEGPRLALPPRVVGEPVVGKLARPAHYGEIGLDLAVAALRFLD